MSIVSRLMFAIICTKPNATYLVNVVNRFMVNLEIEYYKIMMWNFEIS